jgi:hypothetical protein
MRKPLAHQRRSPAGQARVVVAVNLLLRITTGPDQQADAITVVLDQRTALLVFCDVDLDDLVARIS